MRRGVYQCECGTRLHVRQIVKNAVRECAACKRPLPQKLIMQCYYARRRKRARKIRLTCVCGKASAHELPTGAGKCACPRCGAQLFEVKTKIIKGAAFPRYIEFNQNQR